jgi:hypothetical protein
MRRAVRQQKRRFRLLKWVQRVEAKQQKQSAGAKTPFRLSQYSEKPLPKCCQKVYGVARFPSLVSSSSFLKVKSANLGPSS